MTKQERMYNCLLYGAYGDAFGADLEMLTIDEIRQQYGEHGKQVLAPTDTITDDTQMTLFTLEGLALSQGKSMDERVQIMYESYLRWFNTQYGPGAIDEKIAHVGELWKIDELYEMRAPGHACIDSLRSGNMGTLTRQFNESLGNGTVMRSAPFGFLISETPEYVFELSMRCAAITHGHREAQIAAGLFSLIIYYLIETDKTLHDAIVDAMVFYTNWREKTSLDRIAGDSYNALINGSRCAGQFKAFHSFDMPRNFWNNISTSWIAPHALGEAVFYSMYLQDNDLLKKFAVHTSNVDGDSDTIASITGNIIGATISAPILKCPILEPYESAIESMLAQISSISPK